MVQASKRFWWTQEHRAQRQLLRTGQQEHLRDAYLSSHEGGLLRGKENVAGGGLDGLRRRRGTGRQWWRVQSVGRSALSGCLDGLWVGRQRHTRESIQAADCYIGRTVNAQTRVPGGQELHRKQTSSAELRANAVWQAGGVGRGASAGGGPRRACLADAAQRRLLLQPALEVLLVARRRVQRSPDLRRQAGSRRQKQWEVPSGMLRGATRTIVAQRLTL